MIKSTNLSFGNAPTQYRTMATDQMDLQVPQGEDRGAQLEKNRQLKVTAWDLPGRIGPKSRGSCRAIRGQAGLLRSLDVPSVVPRAPPATMTQFLRVAVLLEVQNEHD